MPDLYDTAAAYPYTLGRTSLIPQRRGGLVRLGWSPDAIRWRAGRSGLQRTSRDAYLLGGHAPDLLDRLRALLLVLPKSAVIGYQTAAALHGFGVVPSTELHVIVPADTPVPQRRGVVAHESVVSLDGCVEVLGIPCSAPARTAIDLARAIRRRDALPVLDAALRSGVRADDLNAELGRHKGLRGVRQVRELVQLADPRPECRQESQLRLLLHDGKLVGFVPQVEVLADGRTRYRIDLADEENRVGLEYDGASHHDRVRAHADRRRHNWLAARGWTMRYFTNQDLYRYPDDLLQTVAAAQRRSRRNRRG